MPTLKALHHLTRRFGVDLTQLRYSDSDWALRMRLLRSLSPDVVVDVGANTGQFASELRLAGYGGSIVSFEPVSDAYRQLSVAARADPSWTTVQAALGDKAEQVIVNVSANSLSSSILGMKDAHLLAAPGSSYVRQEQIMSRRLDEIEILDSYHRIFCKIDTQGFEQRVLEGIGKLWPRVVAIQIETSHVQLYQDSWVHKDVISFFENMEWVPIFVDRGFTDPRSGRMLQSDWTFAPLHVVTTF